MVWHFGIDTQVHLGALDSKIGKTIAVLGSGINNIFPEENKGLAKQIVESGGVLVSEYLPKEHWKSHYFPVRNHIIVGLSLRNCCSRGRI